MYKSLPKLTALAASLLHLTTATAGVTPQLYMDKVTTFFSKLEKNSSTLWPNFEVATKPLLIVLPSATDDGVYALNFTPKDVAAWQKKQIGATTVYYLPHDTIGAHKFRISLDAPYFMVEGQPAYLHKSYDLFDAESDDQRLLQFDLMSLATAYFDIYQVISSPNAAAKLALATQEDTITYDSFNQQGILALLLVESNSLKSYLETHNEEALKDYAALFQYRYSRLDKNAQQLDVNVTEMSPDEYIAYKSLSDNDDDFNKMALNEFPELWDGATGEGLQDIYRSALRFNLVAVAAGLDKVQPDWKIAVDALTAMPSQLLQQHYHFTEQEMLARVAAAKNRYHYATIMQDLFTIMTPYLSNMHAAEADYAQAAGVELTLSLPARHVTSTYSSKATYQINSVEKLIVDSAKFELSNKQKTLALKAQHIAALYEKNIASMETNFEKDLSVFRLKVTETTKIIVDGKTDTVAHFVATNQSVPFHTLSLQADQTDTALSINVTVQDADYRLQVDAGKLVVTKSDPMQV